MKNKIFWIALLGIFCLGDLYSQGGSAFGLKFGPTVGFQRWNNRDSELLFRYHGVAYIETYSEEAAYALFAQVGYHVRGGALRVRGGSFRNLNNDNVNIATRTSPYEFRNISLSVGAKQRFALTEQASFYYLLGIRGEFTVNDNLSDYHPENDPLAEFNVIHPFPGSNVRRVNYGVIVGGGIDFMFSELVGGLIELSISPDFSQQYFSPSLSFDSNLNGSSLVRTIQERRINNVSIELSIGLRFLRIVEYVNKVY